MLQDGSDTDPHSGQSQKWLPNPNPILRKANPQLKTAADQATEAVAAGGGGGGQCQIHHVLLQDVIVLTVAGTEEANLMAEPVSTLTEALAAATERDAAESDLSLIEVSPPTDNPKGPPLTPPPQLPPRT